MGAPNELRKRQATSFLSLSTRSRREVISCNTNLIVVQTTHPQITRKPNQQALYNLFAAYLHTVPLEELIESFERARRDAQLRYMVLYGASCSYCLSRAARLDGSYLRTFALELKEQLAQILATYTRSILDQSRGFTGEKTGAEPPIRQIVTVLRQIMCKHDAEKLAISVLEICKDC